MHRRIAVVGAPGANGRWEYRIKGSTAWAPMGAVSGTDALLLPADASVRFVPKKDFNGKVTLTFRAWDQTEGGATDNDAIAARSLST